MHYRQLGRTGPKVSVIGLGGNTFGRTVSQTMTTRICDAARDQGINTIDTADVYGKGLSERMVGRAIASRHRDWILMTKFGYPMVRRAHRAARPGVISARRWRRPSSGSARTTSTSTRCIARTPIPL